MRKATLVESITDEEVDSPYPRAALRLRPHERLEALAKAYFGLGTACLVTFGVGVSLLALLVSPLGTDRSGVLGWLIPLAPVVVAILSSLPATLQLARASGWPPDSGVLISTFLGVFILGTRILTPVFPDEGLGPLILRSFYYFLIAMAVFPVVRLAPGLMMRRFGVAPGFLGFGNQRIQERIEALQSEEEALFGAEREDRIVIP